MHRLNALANQLHTPCETVSSAAAAAAAAAAGTELRGGIIGLDTSHSTAFAKALNAADKAAILHGCRIVAATPRGSADIASSVERIPGYTEEVQAVGVKVVDSISELITMCDVVFLETNDGRPRLAQALEVIDAGLPMFIDKPVAASLSDTLAIYAAAKAKGVPIFSASSLRWAEGCSVWPRISSQHH
jgi:predicted dehydrogenase